MYLILYFYFILCASEILSLLNQFTITSMRIITILLILTFMLLELVKKHRTKNIKLRPIYLIFLTFFGSISAFQGYFISKNNWDSMTYHFPRFLHWFTNRNLDFFYTTIERQNFMPILPDLLFAHNFSIFGNDKLLFLPIWLSVLVTNIYIYKTTFLFTKNTYQSFLAGLICLTIPSQLSFMASTQTDPISTALIAILLYYTLVLKDKYSKSHINLAILIFPLLVTSKTTGLIFSIPIYLFLFYKYRQHFYIDAVQYLFKFIIFILPSIPYALRVFRSDSIYQSNVFVSGLSFTGTLTNTFRIILTSLQTPFISLNLSLEAIFYKATKLLGVSANPTGYGNYGDFYLSNAMHGDVAGNSLHLILLVCAIVGLWKFRKYRLLIVIVVADIFLMGLLIGWQPWINRFFSSILVIGSILMGIWLGRKRMFLQVTVLFLFVFSSFFWLLFNPTRSLLNPNLVVYFAERFTSNDYNKERIRHDLILTRESQYFSSRPEIENSYLSALKIINVSNIERLYLKIGSDDYEYPIWALTNFQLEVFHFREEDTMELEKNNSYLFCTVACDQYQLKLLYKDNYVSLWR